MPLPDNFNQPAFDRKHGELPSPLAAAFNEYTQAQQAINEAYTAVAKAYSKYGFALCDADKHGFAQELTDHLYEQLANARSVINDSGADLPDLEALLVLPPQKDAGSNARLLTQAELQVLLGGNQ